MLTINVKGAELYNEETSTFFAIESTTLKLEHSLVSISKWESKWHKPFLSMDKKTREETIDYIRCMTVTQNINPAIYSLIDNEEFEKINSYIDDKMTATTITRTKTSGPSVVVTSELIYYWMIAFTIPFECEKWHLNRLLTLIEICELKNKPQKKMSRSEVIAKQRELNATRRQALNTRG
jgi:hypothetical protein